MNHLVSVSWYCYLPFDYKHRMDGIDFKLEGRVYL